MTKTYEIKETVNTHGTVEKSIKCFECGRTSWHPDDVRHKYCGNCNKFHEVEVVRRRRSTG